MSTSKGGPLPQGKPPETFEAKKGRLLSRARSKLKKTLKLISALEEDRKGLAASERCKKWGDICQAYFNSLRRGLSEITLEDPETGVETVIPLSPELGPAENISLLYKKHRKFRTGMEKTGQMLERARKKADEERIMVASIEGAEGAEELEALAGEEPGPGIKPAEKGKKKKEAFPGYRRFFSSQGFEMIVGRNDVQNDDLVRHSKGNDLWLHIRDFPGSHVVVRSAKKEVPFETVLEAARLALKFSTKARDMKGTVVYTHVKNLRRPKNAPPGRVLVTREKTVTVSLGD